MLSNLLELLGLAGLTVAAYLMGGAAPAVITGSVALMFVGLATDDAAIARLLRTSGRRARGAVTNTRATIRARRQAKAERLNTALRTILRAVDRSG